MPATAYAKVQYKYEINCDGKSIHIPVSGNQYDSKGYIYTKGTAPSLKNEIVQLLPQVSEKTGAKIGDVITIDFGTEKLDCVVVAYF